jgi:hypothetical protein
MTLISWFTGLAIPQRLAFAAIVALILVGGFFAVRSLVNDGLDRVEEKGAATAAAKAATEGLKNVQTGNEAAEAVRRDDSVRRAGCLRHSRTPENC